MHNIQNMYQLILEMNKLKLVFRNTISSPDRKESTAEHSWSVSMITVILMENLKKEFADIDELKTIKLALIHDIVEIYAGDVMAFDTVARKEKETIEVEALNKLILVYPEFGQQLQKLWHEFELKETLEAKIAKAADAICPIFQRVQSKQSYIPFEITIEHLEKVKYPHFEFSKTFTSLYQQLKMDLINQQLILSHETIKINNRMTVRFATNHDSKWIEEYMEKNWGGLPLVIRGKQYHPNTLTGIVAENTQGILAFLFYEIRNSDCEIIVFEVFNKFKGTGSIMLNKLKEIAKTNNCHRIYLMTTNDNLDALRFYQRREFKICGIHIDSVKISRKIKPSIGIIGDYDIPLRDEIDLELIL